MDTAQAKYKKTPDSKITPALLSSSSVIPDYYLDSYHLHWDPDVPRLGVGNLLKKVNHVAIIVSDVALSLSWYTNVLGFQQIRRPNFDRHGAWLTMGNIELHLIKGNPLVFEGDNLIVGHISVETDHPEEVLRRLNQMGIKFTKNISVPDAKGVTPITQYFLRDPDGYYIELCNCDILTKFCLGKDEIGIQYGEAVEHVDLSKIFLLSLLIDYAKRRAEGADTPLPQDQWAAQADPVKTANLLTRCKIWGDVVQGETEESISLALRQSNNSVPRAIRILKASKGGGEFFIPPAVIVQGETRYQPAAVQVRRKEKGKEPIKVTSLVELAARMFKEIDKDGSGTITKEELKKTARKTPSKSYARNTGQVNE
jgi:catechol 2,3-dioxygenase-like lactoylglutathione lyase family enzyme